MLFAYAWRKSVYKWTLPIRLRREISRSVPRGMLEGDLSIAVGGSDLNRTALDMARLGKGDLFIYDIMDQNPSLLGRYDAVFLLDVIEHIVDDTAFVTAALRHLRTGGLVAVNVPANMLFFSEYDKAAGHVRRYTPRKITYTLAH